MMIKEAIVCPTCKSEVEFNDDYVNCLKCKKGFPIKGNVPFLLLSHINLIPDEHKEEIIDRFKTIDKDLDKSFANFVTFLTLGYMGNGSKEYAVREPEKFCFNKFSTKLFLEVIGDYDFNNKLIAEIGSGRGGNLATINKYFQPKASIGVDLSYDNIKFCNEILKTANIKFLIGDAEELPLANTFFDVVLNIESSHYYPNKHKFFDEAYRITKSGGHFFYADIYDADMLKQAEEYLIQLGFSLIRNQDISPNVLLSCNQIASIREMRKDTGLYRTFTVIPGNEVYEDLKSGKKAYKILVFKK